MKRKYKKVKRHIKNNHKHWLYISLFGLIIITGLIVKQQFFPPVFPLFHGPHLSKALYKSGLNQGETLGAKIKRKIFRPTPTPTQKPTPTPTPQKRTLTLVPTPTPLRASSTKVATKAEQGSEGQAPTHNQYGIAAGGGLPYFNQADLDIYFSQLKELGVTWVRYDFEWGLIQKNGSTSFDWSGTDRIVQTASKYGINTLGTIAYAPAWARLSACSGEFACAPADPSAFGLFAGQIASRYASLGVHYWEIWNEQNIVVFWKPAPNVNSYVAILKSAYENIKKVDPSAIVLSGGLAIAGDEDNNIAPITFISAMYDSDTTKDFDGIAIHPYTYPALASYPASWNHWLKINAIRQLMITHGDSNKPLWLTEYGAPTGGPGSSHDTTQLDNFIYGKDFMTETAQEMMMNDVLSLFSQLQGPSGPFFWYSLKDNGSDKSTPENFFGLLRFDNSKKPAYYKFQSEILNSN